MKLFFGLFLMLSSMGAASAASVSGAAPVVSPVTACSDDELALGESLLDRTRKLWEHGFGTKTDMLLVKDAVLDLRLCAQKVSPSDYCSQKEELLTELLQMAQLSVEHEDVVGPDSLGTAYRMGELMRELVALRQSCFVAPANPSPALSAPGPQLAR